MYHILVVDDEYKIRELIRKYAEFEGYSVDEAENGMEAMNLASQNAYDLIVMDIMMPMLSGIDAAAEIRKLTTAPILFVTAKSLDSDKEMAYVAGGDDYLVKPFSSKELLLKVESLLRRYIVYRGKEAQSELLCLLGEVEVDVENRIIYKRGNEIALRDKENDIFFFLLSHRGETIESNAIYEAVWQEKSLPSSANNVMVNMLNIRKKLEDDPSNPRLIRTVWGKGYRFE
jgi:DNA-binding response OmpR family regulator